MQNIPSPSSRGVCALGTPTDPSRYEQFARSLPNIIGVALIFIQSAVAWGGEPDPKVFWSADFNDPHFFETTAKVFYEGKGSGKTGDHLIKAEVKDGVLVYSLKFEAGREGGVDRSNLLFGDLGWWDQKTKWGPVNLKEFPILEIKWRGSVANMYYDVETVSGERKQGYTGVNQFPSTKVKDSNGKEWNVSTFRAAVDSSVPSVNTPITLRGINFEFYEIESEDYSMDISSIKIRALNSEEARREKNVIGILKDYKRPDCKITEDFFPFGVFDVGFLHGPFEYWGGDHRGACGWMGRNYFNCVASDYELQFTRNWNDGKDLQGAIDLVKKKVEYAQENGIKYVADLRSISECSRIDVASDEGFQKVKERMEIIAKAFKGNETVIGWYLADEPGIGKMLALTAEKRAMDESDPEHRPVIIVFNNPSVMSAYRAYLSVNYWDLYPVVKDKRNPLTIKETARTFRKAAPELPAWAILQAFEARARPVPKEDFVLPTAAEIRLMTYAALAEGVKGIIWFTGWDGTGSYNCLVSRTGEPFKEVMDTCSELGRLLIPIGKLLLKTEVDEQTSIRIIQYVEDKEEPKLSVSVLKHRQRPINYLVVLNEKINSIASGKLDLGPELKTKNLYDLNHLKPVMADKDGTFLVETLAGGDGRIYLVSDQKTFEETKMKVRTGRISEDLRVLLPDIAILKKWGADLRQVDDAIAKCGKAVGAKNLSEAERQAACARESVNAAFESDSVLNLCRRTLADMSHELTQLSLIAERQDKDPHWWWPNKTDPMLVPNPTFLESSKRYWEAGRQFSDIYNRYLLGQRENLWEDMINTRLQILSVREDLQTVLKKRLNPEKRPTMKDSNEPRRDEPK